MNTPVEIEDSKFYLAMDVLNAEGKYWCYSNCEYRFQLDHENNRIKFSVNSKNLNSSIIQQGFYCFLNTDQFYSLYQWALSFDYSKNEEMRFKLTKNRLKEFGIDIINTERALIGES